MEYIHTEMILNMAVNFYLKQYFLENEVKLLRLLGNIQYIS